MDFQDILYVKDSHGIVTVTLNRPEALNGTTPRMNRELAQAVRTAKALIPQLEGKSLEEQVDLSVETLVRLRSSPEGQEGLTAFLERRAAAWQKQ